MRKAKEIIGMAIVHQQTAQLLAYARDLVFTPDGQRLAAILVDTGGWFKDARVIPWSAVTRVGDVILVGGDPVVKATEAPELAESLRQEVKISGTPIVTASGERIGTVDDLFIDDDGAVVGYEVGTGFLGNLGGRKFLAANYVSSVGRDAVIADSGNLQPAREGLKHAVALRETAGGDEVAPAPTDAPPPSSPAPVDTPDPELRDADDAAPREPLS